MWCHSPHWSHPQTRTAGRHHETRWPSLRPYEICALHSTPACNVRTLGRSVLLSHGLAKPRACVCARPMQTGKTDLRARTIIKSQEKTKYVDVSGAILAPQLHFYRGVDFTPCLKVLQFAQVLLLFFSSLPWQKKCVKFESVSEPGIADRERRYRPWRHRTFALQPHYP